MIYRIARTSPYLTGQTRIDIILNDDAQNSIQTEGLYVVPLSDSIACNEEWQKDCLCRSHNDNVRFLYRATQGDFFNDVSQLDITLWQYEKEVDGIVADLQHRLIDTTMLMGVKRMRYSQYNKQFSYLCPIWVTNEADVDDLVFHICIRESGQDTTRVEKVFALNDNICNYLKGWLDGVNEEVININFDRDSIYIKGIEAETGTFQTKDVSYELPNILSRERPMMETDTLFANLLRNNGIVAQQMLNLNFVFNMEDLVPASMANEMYGKQWNVYVEVWNTDGKIDTKDLYTNYTFIPSFVIGNDTDINTGGWFSDSANVLDYLDDDKAIQLIYENKFSQPLFHWSLVDNPGMTFNFYNGFSPYVDYSNEFVEELPEIGFEDSNIQVEGRYYDQPDMTHKEYDVSYNNCNWCRLIDASTWAFPEFDISNLLNQDSSNFTALGPSGGIVWVNDNKFNTSSYNPAPVFDSSHNGCNIHANIVFNNHAWQPASFNDSFNPSDPYSIEYVYDFHNALPSVFPAGQVCMYIEGSVDNNVEEFYITLCILHGRESFATAASLASFDTGLINIGDPKNNIVKILLEYIQQFLKCWEPPFKIEFTDTIIPCRVEGPVLDTKEIGWKKQDGDVFSYIYRYGGSLMPQFISLDDAYRQNKMWKRKYWTDSQVWSDEVQVYNRLLQTGYDPFYPSINYFSLEEIKERYDELVDLGDVVSFDLCWFDQSSNICLVTNGNIDVTKQGPLDDADQQMIKACIMQMQISGLIDVVGHMVWDLNGEFNEISEFTYPIPILADAFDSFYNIDIHFDYASNDNIIDIIYNITYKLK